MEFDVFGGEEEFGVAGSVGRSQIGARVDGKMDGGSGTVLVVQSLVDRVYT